TYGPRTVDLINITNNDICSLFYYSCSITNKFSTTQLNACGTIQTTALRTALGLPNWTPNVVLLKISGQETLADKMKRLAVKFFIKQISNNDYSPIHSCRQNLSIHLTKKDEESLLAHLTDLNISPNHIITLPKASAFQCEIYDIHTSDLGFQNKAQPTAFIEGLFNDFISNNFEDYFIIASKSLVQTSIAGISNQHSFVFRIHPINSIFTAEALAICQAIDDLSIPEKNLMNLTHSLSVLQVLKTFPSDLRGLSTACITKL
ncbi:hypothetical protein AVEN_133784-1, partial [Araneus ventricosus]